MTRTALSLIVASTALAACADASDGIEIAAFTGGALRAPAGDVTLTTAQLTVTSLELVPCQTVAARAFDLLVPRAWAHVESSPTVTGNPVVLDVLSDSTFRLGTFTPPPGRYCTIDVLVTPADEDAFDVDDVTLGRTLVVAGTRNGAPFQQSTALSFERSYPIDPPLDTDDDAGVLVRWDESAWFENTTLAWDDPFLLAQQLLARAFDTLTVERGVGIAGLER